MWMVTVPPACEAISRTAALTWAGVLVEETSSSGASYAQHSPAAESGSAAARSSPEAMMTWRIPPHWVPEELPVKPLRAIATAVEKRSGAATRSEVPAGGGVVGGGGVVIVKLAVPADETLPALS